MSPLVTIVWGVVMLAAAMGRIAAQPAAPGPLPDVAELDRLAAESRARWAASPHGLMLARILPERLKPSQLPEPASRGARLTALYCVQCHHLPNPAMHDAARWERVVARMVPRMQGKGNMGALMAEMMRGPGGPGAGGPGVGGSGLHGSGAGRPGDGVERPLAAPTAQETREIVVYLQRHALRPAGPELAGALATPGGQMFARACSQCHVLPDPGRHRASEWPAVVRRMEANMAWMNRVVGSQPDPREPRLEPADITAFLQQHAARGARAN